jgi:glycosyltransferase involved in cell wall biosynthesis
VTSESPPAAVSVSELLRRWFVRGRLRPVGRVLYNAVIAAELGAQRALDALQPPAASPALDEVTVIVKTFERPHVARRLVASIRRRFPGLRVIVADDSRVPVTLEGARTLALPYDSGVSAGRAAALAAVETPYLFLLDDDFVLYRHTRLAEALAFLRQYPQIDILGGRVINLPFFTSSDYRRAFLFPTQAQATLPPGSVIGGLPVYDKVPNFYLARTERVRLVGWDPRIKRIDHADFFTRAKGVLTSVYDARLCCLHARTPFNGAYRSRRDDDAQDRAVLWERYYRKRS